MPIFRCEVDLSEIQDMGNGIPERMRDLAVQAQKDLGQMTYGKILEYAKERLHTRYMMFADKFHLEPDKDGEAVLTLEKSAVWIDEGLEPNYLLEALLNSPKAKTSADGSKYIVVPFTQGSPGMGPTNTTPYQMDIVGAIKDQLKKKNIPWQKIQRDSEGRPILGKIADLKLKTPVKTKEGPGMGHGAVGDPRQGRTGIPFLRGAGLYQSQDGDKVKRSIVTFRTASSNHPENFQHPGLPATNLMEDGFDWALDQLEKEILPKLIRKVLDT